MTMPANWMWHDLTQGIRTIETFTMYKKCYYWYFYHKKTQETVTNVEITVTKLKQLVKGTVTEII